MTLWVDYSDGRPGGAALAAARVTGAFRYVSAGSPGKLITAAEYADLVAHGIRVLLVDELNTHDAEGGFTAGAARAQAALSTARAYGIPDSVGIAAAADEHLTAALAAGEADVTSALAYVAGFVSVLGLARTGAYGPAELIDAVHATNAAEWTWKWGTAPTAAEQAWLTFWQRNAGQTTQVINGVTCDLNDQFNSIPGGPMTNPDETVLQRGSLPGAPETGTTSVDAVAEYSDANKDLELAAIAKDDTDINAVAAQVAALASGVQSSFAVLAAQVAALQPTELTGTATVTIPLTPKTS